MHRLTGIALLTLGVSSLGCGPTVDPPRPVDAGETLADTGVEPGDAGFPADTGIVVDGGSVTDSGVAEDAGVQGPVECGGPIQTPCPQGYVCVKNDGLCDGRPNGQIPTGTCQPVLAQCPEAAEDDAVCGCGGATYASRCHAQLHNEDVMEPGICRDQRGYNRCSAAGAPGCGRDDDFYCATPLGHCDAVPFCMPNPNMCSQEESPERGSPVCDCEGNEHHNLCNARRDGKSVRNTGPCR